MKKILLILATLLLVTGCGMSDKEKEDMLYNSLEKAYISVFAGKGVGLAVYPEEKLEIDGKIWYQVAINEYKSLSKLTSLADDVYTEKIADKINKEINKKYKETDTELYTISEGGCTLNADYQYGKDLKDKIKQDVKIKKIKMSKIIFEYKGKEYEAKKSKDNYIFDKQIFECVES